MLQDDGEIEKDEFIYIWKDRQLGDLLVAGNFYHHLDTDQDGVVTEVPDMFRVFYYFDNDRECYMFKESTIAAIQFYCANISYLAENYKYDLSVRYFLRTFLRCRCNWMPSVFTKYLMSCSIPVLISPLG